jgi:hypothetical protein
MTTETLVDARGHLERRTRLFTTGDLWAGALGGLVGGLVMGVVAFFATSFYAQNIDVWAPVKLIAGIVYPAPVVTRPGFDLGPVVTGLLIQIVMSAVLGMVFAVLYRRVLQLPFKLGLPYLMGAVYGFALWALTFIFLPRLNPVMADADKPAFLVAHVAYGIVLGLCYQALRPQLPRRDEPVEEAP